MCNNNTNQITDINTLQFIHKLCNFIHIISMQSNAAAITLSGSGAGQFKNLDPVHPYLTVQKIGKLNNIQKQQQTLKQMKLVPRW